MAVAANPSRLTTAAQRALAEDFKDEGITVATRH